ncbi:MAG: helix-turn-helix domain-containing protein [Alphaproteobacteria bacterium]|nr:helix-turn-helix domain-containing protein [Alphaproteobacteria bacterium]
MENRTDSLLEGLGGVTFAAGATEDVLAGGRLLRQAFREAPRRSADRGTMLVGAETRDPPVFMLDRGFAYRAFSLPDGRRAIVDILLPGDVAGLDHAILGRATHDVIAANMLGYRSLSPPALRDLMAARPSIALHALALMAETRARCDSHTIAITRLDARERIATFVLGVYQRLRRRELIARPTFNLPLTQEQVADHLGLTMVHVSRTLRRLREERLLHVDRQVVIILDLDGLRAVAAGLSVAPHRLALEIG